MIAKAIFLTLVALAGLGSLGWLVFRTGWLAGRAKLRSQLGIAGQRKIKMQELLANEAHALFVALQTPGRDLADVSYLSDPHAEAINEWIRHYQKRL